MELGARPAFGLMLKFRDKTILIIFITHSTKSSTDKGVFINTLVGGGAGQNGGGAKKVLSCRKGGGDQKVFCSKRGVKKVWSN